MGEFSKIEWCTHTFNPWIGCAKVSAGCTNCYAETLMDTRYGRVEWGVNGTRVRTSEANWRKPLAWNRAAEAAGRRDRVFCSSLADVFEDRPELVAWRRDLLMLIHNTPHLDWLLLTKRPENVLGIVVLAWFAEHPNVWIGTSVEDQAAADERIPHLLRIPAAVRFLSMEPLLGPVDLRKIRVSGHLRDGLADTKYARSFNGEDYVTNTMRRIDWVIVGGESGPKARPMHRDWVRSIRDQCVTAGVPFLFKQWGEYAPRFTIDPTTLDLGEGMFRVGKHAAGRMLDGCEWNSYP